MLNRRLLRSFLAKKMSIHSYQICMYTPQDHQWTIIEQYNRHSNTLPAVIPFPDSNYSVQLSNNETLLYFHYKDGYQIVILLPPESEGEVQRDTDTLDILYYLLYPSYAERAMNEKERETMNIIDGIRSITSSLDTDDLVNTILSNVTKVIPGADTAILWLYDPTIDRLICRSYIGGWNEELMKVQYRVGESVTGNTFLDGKPRVYRSFRKAMQATKEHISEENANHLYKAFHNHNVNASISIPISIGDKRIGVLGIHQTTQGREITERDVQLLMGYSAQIAIAIENARLFTEVKQQNEVLVKRDEVHTKLTQLSIQNRGVEIIAQELSRMLRLPIIFVDMLEEEYFPKLESLRAYLSIDELSILFSKRKIPIKIDLIESNQLQVERQTLYLHPIVVGSVLSGCFIVYLRRSLTDLDRIFLEQGASVLALELVKKQSLTEVYYKKNHDFFTALLGNENPEVLYIKGIEQGIDLHSYLFAAVIEISIYEDLQVLEAFIHRLVSRIKHKLSDFSKLVFGFHNKVTLLFSLPDPSNTSKLIRNLESIVMQWNLTERPILCAGVGSLYQGIQSIKKTYNEAEKALSYLVYRQQNGIIKYSEIGINRLFLNQPVNDMEKFIKEVFDPLNSTKPQNSDLERTIITYIKTNRSASETAEKLHIHVNTLYQRLKKIEELLHVSLNEPEDLLKVHLACHLRESFRTIT